MVYPIGTLLLEADGLARVEVADVVAPVDAMAIGAEMAVVAEEAAVEAVGE
jgi:hypothetical protein